MCVGVVKTGDDCFTLTVYEPGPTFEGLQVVIEADRYYLTSSHRHQFRHGSLRVQCQYIGIIEDKVCCC